MAVRAKRGRRELWEAGEGGRFQIVRPNCWLRWERGEEKREKREARARGEERVSEGRESSRLCTNFIALEMCIDYRSWQYDIAPVVSCHTVLEVFQSIWSSDSHVIYIYIL